MHSELLYFASKVRKFFEKITSLEDLKQQLEERLEHSRVSSELQNISGQFFARSVWKLVVRAVLHAALVIAAMRLVFTASSDCTLSCVLSEQGVCCGTTRETVARVGCSLLVALAGSFLSSKLTATRKFQFSAFMSALTLIAVGIALVSTSAPLSFIATVMMGLFVALFLGYRLAH